MTLPLVSIAITTYNRREEVVQAALSAMKQTYKAIEIIVVDDGSDDGTVLPSDPRLQLIRHEKNMGIAAAKNTALRAGTGVFKGLIDSDDNWHPGFVARCVKELQAFPDIGLVYVDNDRYHENKKIAVDKALDWDMERWLSTCNWRGDSWLARAEFVDACPHDERFELEVDGDFLYQMARLTKFKRIAEVHMSVKEHGGRKSRDSLQAAYWHAAGLGKYGHSIEYAYARAERGKSLEAWRGAIERGYTYGVSLRGDDNRGQPSTSKTIQIVA